MVDGHTAGAAAGSNSTKAQLEYYDLCIKCVGADQPDCYFDQ